MSLEEAFIYKYMQVGESAEPWVLIVDALRLTPMVLTLSQVTAHSITHTHPTSNQGGKQHALQRPCTVWRNHMAGL